MILKIPTLEGQVHRDVVVAIEMLRKALVSNTTVVEQVVKDLRTAQQAVPSIYQISQALSSGGQAPVSVTGSTGALPASPRDARLYLQRCREADVRESAGFPPSAGGYRHQRCDNHASRVSP